MLGSDGKSNTPLQAGARGCENFFIFFLLHFPLVLVNRLNKTESAVFLYCRFSLFLKDPVFQIILVMRQTDTYLLQG